MPCHEGGKCGDGSPCREAGLIGIAIGSDLPVVGGIECEACEGVVVHRGGEGVVGPYICVVYADADGMADFALRHYPICLG